MISWYSAQSRDGFAATVEGGLDWLRPFEPAAAGAETMLMGRRTFEACRARRQWPYTGRPVWVHSRRALGTLPPQVQATAAALPELATCLKARGVGRAWLADGGELAGALLAAGLIDRLVVSVMPVQLGDGLPLFGDRGAGAWPLVLERVQQGREGIVQFTYRAIA